MKKEFLKLNIQKNNLCKRFLIQILADKSARYTARKRKPESYDLCFAFNDLDLLRFQKSQMICEDYSAIRKSSTKVENNLRFLLSEINGKQLNFSGVKCSIHFEYYGKIIHIYGEDPNKVSKFISKYCAGKDII